MEPFCARCHDAPTVVVDGNNGTMPLCDRCAAKSLRRVLWSVAA